MKRKRYNDPFREMHGAAIGTAGLGITTAVGAGIGSAAPAGTPSVTAGFSTLAGFVPTINTAIGGRVALRQVKKLKKVY